MHFRPVDPDLFEDLATAHHAHQPAARIRPVIRSAEGFRQFEPARRLIRERAARLAVFERLESTMDLTADDEKALTAAVEDFKKNGAY